MPDPITLFIVEGEKRDVRFLKALAEDFMSESRAVRTLVLPAARNIYMLYEQLKKDDFETDIIEVIRESTSETAKALENLHRDEIDEIYLFFDFDPQHFKHMDAGDANDSISKTLIRMLEVFDNETEFGKLYVSYPMIEAIYDYKRSEAPCVAHSGCYITLRGISEYKRLAGKDNPIASKHKPQWKEALNIFTSRAACLFGLENISFLEYRSRVNPFMIYREQEKLLRNDGVVFCLSALPEFLLDYYGEMFWVENINTGITFVSGCEHRIST